MPRYYRKHLHPRLTALLEEQAAGVPPAEQLQVFDELELIRLAAADVVQLYSTTREAYDNETDPAKKERLHAQVLNAGSLMHARLEEVIKAAEAAARIEQGAKDKVSIAQLHYFIQVVTKCAYNAFEGDVKIAQVFEEELRNRIRLPAPRGDGTVFTPDMDVLDMDATIPKEEHGDAT